MVDIKTVGVIGAGQMGSGIAHVVALAGYNVLLHDVSPDRIAQGLALIEKNMTRQLFQVGNFLWKCSHDDDRVSRPESSRC